MSETREALGKKCPHCKAVRRITVEGAPPDPCTATCQKCKKPWKVCGARRKNGPCMKPPLAGKLRCRICGGTSPGGKIVHGRRSKTLPAKWAAYALEAMEDPELVSTRDNLAALEGFKCSLLEEVRDGKSGSEIIEDANRLMVDVRKAIAGKNIEALKSSLDELAALLSAAGSYEKKIDRYLELVDLERKLQETEVRRMAVLNMYVSSQHLAAFMARLRLDVLEVVGNAGERSELARRIAGYFGEAAGRGPSGELPEA